MRMATLMFASMVAGFLSVSTAWSADDATISGVRFDGGDGSYRHAVENGITVVIAADPPSTFQDNRTNSFDGADVRIFREVAKRLGITKVSWNIVPFDAMIPTLLSGRADVIVDNLHETETRLRVVRPTGTVRESRCNTVILRRFTLGPILPGIPWERCVAASITSC